MNNKIIDKIKNLLALSEKTNYVNEAISAISQAEMMMFKFNISRSMLEQHNPNKEEILDLFDHGIFLQENYINNWAGILGIIVAEANNCSVYIKTIGNKKILCIIGSMTDGTVSKTMFDYYQHQVQMLIFQHAGIKDVAWMENYQMGILDTLSEKLNAGIAQSCNQLAIIKSSNNEKKERLQKFLNEQIIVEGGENINYDVDGAYLQGKIDSKEIDLNKIRITRENPKNLQNGE